MVKIEKDSSILINWLFSQEELQRQEGSPWIKKNHPKWTPDPVPLKKQKPESQARAGWPVEEKTQMTNWALQTGWTGLRGKGKGRATETPLAAHKADQRNSTPQRRQGAGNSMGKDCPAQMPRL